MDNALETPAVTIPPVDKEHGVVGLGCWAFGGRQWGGQDDADSLSAMQAALRCGMNHFDTAAAYGNGRSESVVGQFIRDTRDRIFLATKGNAYDASGDTIRKSIDESLERLGVDAIDLYYIHWPSKGKDLRPVMEALEEGRAAGKIRAIGVSNYSVEQMEQVSEVGRIDAHQLCYSLLWRFGERDVIPYCAENNIAVVSYSSIAQGILTGKFARDVEFPDTDQRKNMILFAPEAWPHVYEAVEQFKALAARADRPLTHLAIRWVAARKDITSVLVGARNAKQAEQIAAAMQGEIAPEILDEMTAISDEVAPKIPDVGNIFRWYP